MSGKILYLPVATLPEEEIKLPPDPLAGCRLMTDVRPHHHGYAVGSLIHHRLRRRSPFPIAMGKAWVGAALVGAAYVAACVIWPVALWAAPVAVAVGVAAYGSYYF